MPFSDKQIDFLKHSTHSFNISSGPISTGKTYAQVLRWHDFVQNQVPEGALLLMSGRNSETLYDNVIRDFTSPAVDDAHDYKLTRQPQRIHFPRKGIEIACASAENEASWGRVQGKTVAGWLADEITQHPKSFVQMAQGRCRHGGKVWPKLWTCNPDSPQHFVKKDYIDNAKLDVKNWYWGFEDNPILTPELIAEYKESHTGVFYERMVNGKWTLAEGVIYINFSRANHVISEYDPSRIETYVLGIDWGWEHNLVLVLMGIDHDGIYYILDEISTKHQNIDKSLVDLMREKGWYSLRCGEREMEIEYAYADSSRPDSISQFDEISGIMTIPADKRPHSVVEGIQTVQRCLSKRGDGQYGLYVLEKCTNVINGFEAYRWKVQRDGTSLDEPFKIDDDEMDAVRYPIFTAAGSRVKFVDV